MQKLLHEVSRIHEKYRFLEEKTGARFNVYSVARIERSEVIVHSRMIAELLDPSGIHGQGNVFLGMFLRTVLPNRHGLNCEGAKIGIEKSFSHDESASGRIDIIIELLEAVIVIENKIDALDQKLQLSRYRDHANEIKRGREIFLFYLTPDRREPSETSLGPDNQPKVGLLSYPEEIAAWLDQCLLYCVNSRLYSLTEGIGQYRRLIDKISGNTMTKQERNEVDRLFDNSANLLAAERISERFQSSDFRGKLLWKFLNKVQEELEILGYHIPNNDHPVPETIKKFTATEQNLIQWCNRTRNKDWECKGVFLELPQGLNGDFLCCVMFATDALHYGLVPKCEQATASLPTHKEWEHRNWPKGMHWYSCIEDEAAYRFKSDTLALLSSPEKITEFAKKINEEIFEATSIQHQAPR